VETFRWEGGRAVSVHLPPGRATSVVFCGDGQVLTAWGVDLDSATAVVGVHRVDDETERLHEYSPTLAPERFDAHERFLVGEVVPWSRERFSLALPPERTAVLGVSAGGELALALGLRHPEVFGAVLCASPGGGFAPPPLSGVPPRTYLVAGTDEPFFLENATRWADALRAAGGEVVLAERPGEHGDPFWRAEFPRMVGWAFGG
jgi:enterochelin esterase-like enzyme